MIGTIVNTCTIIAGTLLGAWMHRGIKEKYKEVLYTGLGLASLAIGLNATISNFPKSEYPSSPSPLGVSSARGWILTDVSNDWSIGTRRKGTRTDWVTDLLRQSCCIASVHHRCWVLLFPP